MRKLLAVLAVCVAAVIPAASLAAPAIAGGRPAVHHLFHRGGPAVFCTYSVTGEIQGGGSPSWSEVWLIKHSCNPTYVYNSTYCVARFIGAWWANGPTRSGNGTDDSNSSSVVCNKNGHIGVVQKVLAWVNPGLNGWQSNQIYP